jgi:hypothetical protein
MKKNLLLCIDLKTLLQADILPTPGKQYLGLLKCKLPSEGNIYSDQYEFKEVETTMKTCRRNVHLFTGKYVTITLRSNGSPRLNLRNMELNNIEVDSFCLELMNEIRQALKSLVGNS